MTAVCFGVLGCMCIGHGDFSIVRYDGDVVEMLDARDRCEFVDNLEDLIEGTSDVAKLLVSDDWIDELKDEGRVLKIEFAERRTVWSEDLGNRVVDSVLIPVAGRHVGTSEFPYVLLVLGLNGKYFSGPLVNESGLSLLREMETLLEVDGSR